MKKILIILIAIVSITLLVGVFTQIFPATSTTTEPTDSLPTDLLDLQPIDENSSASVGSTMKEKTMMDELNEVPGSDADSLPSSANAMRPSSVSSSASTQKTVTSSAYLAYTDGVIGNGDTSLLFFHAVWCPSCRESDKDLKALYKEGSASINTYRVDYDSSLELKKRYGVTQQHTFVLIDGKGTVVQTLIGATNENLKNLLIAQ